MVAAWQKISSARRSVARWAGVTAVVLIAACGGERDAAPAGDAGMASADTVPPTATPDPAAADTVTAGAPADTAAPAADTAASTPPATQPTKPAPAPAAKPAPKPAAKPAPKPAPEPAPEPPPEQTATPTPAAAPDTAPAAQDTPQTAAAPLRDAYHQAPKDTVDQATYDGWKQYNLNCARCHGEDVLGSTIAPHLIMSLKPNGPIPTQEAFMQVVCAGRPEKGMPSWCALGMEPAKINQIYSYVKGRSEGKLGPGRPALREGS